MTDIVALSELSDEPVVESPHGVDWTYPSPRLAAVLDRMSNNSTGTATRVRGGLMKAEINTLAALLAADRYALGREHLGRTSIAVLDAALKHFGLHRVDENPPLIVRDGASANDAHVQRLLAWAAERIAECVAKQDQYGQAGASHETTEQQVLTDVMLILDGREPLTKRRWFGCHDLDCDREYRHDGPHRKRTEVDGVEETEVWP